MRQNNMLRPVAFSAHEVELLQHLLMRLTGEKFDCQYELAGIWLHSESSDAELRLLILSDKQLIVSRVLFREKRHGTMTGVYRYLARFCKNNGLPTLVIQSVVSEAMANWCIKNGFNPSMTSYVQLPGFIGGDYLKDIK